MNYDIQRYGKPSWKTLYSKSLQRLISYKSIGWQPSIKIQVVLAIAINYYHYCINYLIVASTIVYQMTKGTMPNPG